MAYLCYCIDHPDAADRRHDATPDHLAYIESIMHRVLVAGPALDHLTANTTGSCFIYDTDFEDEALRLLHDDPYYKAGIYADIQYQLFRPAAGSWIGGKTW